MHGAQLDLVGCRNNKAIRDRDIEFSRKKEK
jgi:hypothetical protein